MKKVLMRRKKVAICRRDRRALRKCCLCSSAYGALQICLWYDM